MRPTEGETHRTVRYRRTLGSDDVAILADVLVEHAAPIVDIDVDELVRAPLYRGCADAVIITGHATGHLVDASFVDRVRRIADPDPIFVGFGVNVDNTAELAPLFHGAIVGTF